MAPPGNLQISSLIEEKVKKKNTIGKKEEKTEIVKKNNAETIPFRGLTRGKKTVTLLLFCFFSVTFLSYSSFTHSLLFFSFITHAF